MDRFIVNGYLWKVHTVNPRSHYLVDRSGVLTVATTDPATLCVYLSADLQGDFKKRVLAHELGHVFCFSYHLLQEIHACCYPERAIEMEEFICNFVADYEENLFSITYRILGDEALNLVPRYLERLVA